MTTSATGGYLAPLDPPQADDADLDQIFGGMIAGVTGLDPTLVWRKWQNPPPAQPDPTVTWCAFGITDESADANASSVHFGTLNNAQGETTTYRQAEFSLMASFYGPAARATAARLRDGLGIAQNREALRLQGLGYVRTDRITGVPDLQNQQFVRRCDAVLRFRRIETNTYPILNLVGSDGSLVVDAGSTTGAAEIGASLATGPIR